MRLLSWPKLPFHIAVRPHPSALARQLGLPARSEEHTSELQSPDQHSFPTRRSSDLAKNQASWLFGKTRIAWSKVASACFGLTACRWLKPRPTNRDASAELAKIAFSYSCAASSQRPCATAWFACKIGRAHV